MSPLLVLSFTRVESVLNAVGEMEEDVIWHTVYGMVCMCSMYMAISWLLGFGSSSYGDRWLPGLGTLFFDLCQLRGRALIGWDEDG